MKPRHKPASRKAGASVAQALHAASACLNNRLEAGLLLAHVVGHGTAWLYAHGDDAIDPRQLASFNALVERRVAGEPVAYLIGNREFYGRSFRVDKRVLIPRPETETLIDWALELPLPPRSRVLDIGTGSGCIALTLAAERPNWRVRATDISKPALQLAKDNCRMFGLDNVQLVAGDLFEAAGNEPFDLIVSNPPYVATGDPHLEQGDLRFEPDTALAAGTDGLQVIRRIAQLAPSHLSPAGWLLVEHGHDQALAVRTLLQQAGLTGVLTRPDLAGIERITAARRST